MIDLNLVFIASSLIIVNLSYQVMFRYRWATQRLYAESEAAGLLEDPTFRRFMRLSLEYHAIDPWPWNFMKTMRARRLANEAADQCQVENDRRIAEMIAELQQEMNEMGTVS